MVAVMVAVTVVVVISVILTVPVPFMHVPAILVAVIMRVAPVGARVRRPVPTSRNPDVSAPVDTPVAIDPDKAGPGRWRAPLIAYRWRRAANDDANLPSSRRRKGGSCNGCQSESANK